MSRRFGMCVSAGPLCPLLTFATFLTSAHSLLSTGQDPWCVNNADTLQDLVGHLGTLKSGISISRQEKRHINDDKAEVQRGQSCLKHCRCRRKESKSCEKLLTLIKEVNVI